MPHGRSEKAGLAEQGWGRRSRFRWWPGDEPVNSAAVVGDQEFPALIDAERRDLKGGARQFAVPKDSLAVMLHAPDAAGRVVAVDVRAAQVGELVAVIDHAAGQRAELRM